MKARTILPTLFFLLFLAFVVYIINKQKQERKEIIRSAIRGEVISTGQVKKGGYDIYYLQGDKKNLLNFDYEEDRIRIYSKDSIFKQAGSDTFYVKKYEDSVWVKLERW